jgi:hypothetical protein
MFLHIWRKANVAYVDVWGVPRDTIEGFNVDLVIGPTCQGALTALIWPPKSGKSVVDQLKAMGVQEI